MLREKKTTRQIQAHETRQKIHDVTFKLIDSYGLEKVSVRDICKAAGVSIGSFYHYFSSKDEIILISSQNLDDLTQSIFNSIDKNTSILDQFIYIFCRQAKHIVLRGPEITSHTLGVHLKRPEMDIFSKKRLFYNYFLEFIKNGQHEGNIINTISAEDICDISQALFRGLWLDWCSHNGMFDLVNRTSFCIKTIITPFMT